MTYQKNFRPGRDFHLLVEPFVGALPKEPTDPSLVLELHPSQENSAKWQWYNYLYHFYRGEYSISISHVEGKSLLSISRRPLFQPKRVPPPVPPTPPLTKEAIEEEIERFFEEEEVGKEEKENGQREED